MASTPDGPFPFTLETNENAVLNSSAAQRRRVGCANAHDVTGKCDLYCITKDGRYVVSAGHWDNSFKVSAIERDRAKVVQTIAYHKDVVTCVAISENDDIVVTGSKDATIMVWEMNSNARINEEPLHVLYGHDDEVWVTHLCF